MTTLDLEWTPEPGPPSPAVLAAREARALVVGLGGGRDSDGPMAKSSFAVRRSASTPVAPARPGGDGATAGRGAGIDGAASCTAAPRPSAPATSRLRLDDALVVPAGALVRGYLRCRALLLVGDVVGNVHCTDGPVVVRSGASLKGRLVAAGDVYVCGHVGESDGGTVITTYGKLTLAPGARVDGDVRSGALDLYDGAMLRGVAKGCED